MPGNDAFQLVQASSGWSSGLRNLLRADFGKWFRTRRWWIQSLLWIGVIDGLLASILFGTQNGPGWEEGLMLYLIFSALFPAVAAVIILQDAIVGEREAGTAHWVLSKPVSRSAFVLSKLFPNLIGVLVTMLLIPGVVAFILLSVAQGAMLDPLRFLGGIAMLWVYMAFFLTLTLMLGTFFNHRAAVIGIPLAVAFGQQMVMGLAPFLAKVLPWTIAIPLNGTDSSLASAMILGQPLPSLSPLIFTLAFSLIFVAVALWRFEREEF